MHHLLRRWLAGCALLAAALAGAPDAESAITVVSTDDPDEGFNDTSPRDPIGGNAGATLGEQRLNVFLRAAEIMATLIPSPIDIVVEGSFDPLTCTPTSATLGSAGASDFLLNFPGAPRANTWYPSALADYLTGDDLNPGESDIVTHFNSSIGTTCAFPNVFYYGLDGNPPGAEFDLLTVVLHELAHGLGFATIVTLSNGQKGAGSGLDDSFMLFLEDHGTGELYPSMTNTERVDASKATGDLHWTGGEVIGAATGLVWGRDGESGHVWMFAPDPQQPGSSVSHFDAALSPNELMEPSYVGPNHDVGLAEHLLHDIGWNSVATTSTSFETTTTTISGVTSTTTDSVTTTLPASTTTTLAVTTTTAAATTTTTPVTTTTVAATTSTAPPTTTTVPATTTTVAAPTTSTTSPATSTTHTAPTTTLAASTTTLGSPTTTTVAPTSTSVAPTTTTTPETTSTTASPTTTTTLTASVTCGDASGDASVTASDALAALRTAVGSSTCLPCVCDVNLSGKVSASDALAVLKHAVGSAVALDCPSC